MRVESHNNLTDIRSAQVTRVVIYDKYDNPIALAVEIEEGVIVTSTAEHPDFNQMLRSLGIDKTVIVHNITQVDLPEIRIPS